MRGRSIPWILLLVLVAGLALSALPASACHPDQGPIAIGDPEEGPFVELTLVSGCPHETAVCVGLDGDIHCLPDRG